MARHDDDYRFRNDEPRNDRGSHLDSMSGSRAGRYGGHEAERGDIYHYAPAGQPGSEYGYGRGSYEHDGMSSGGVAGGARGYGYVYGPGYGGDRYSGRGGSLGGMSDEMGGSHSQGMGRYDQGRGEWFGRHPGGAGGTAASMRVWVAVTALARRDRNIIAARVRRAMHAPTTGSAKTCAIA